MSRLILPRLDAPRGPSTADLVFAELYRRVVELELAPGARLSEQDVARQFGVSRQPVRDAFYRLSQIGLLHIQPQRATTITLISEDAVLQARFIRTALEVETIRAAALAVGAEDLAALRAVVAEQEGAVARGDRTGFHRLDDEFHQRICASSGHEYAWSLIRDNKAHMDRVRYLSLGAGAPIALADHKQLLDALAARDADGAAALMRVHLSRIVDIIAGLRDSDPGIFLEAS
jgi:GntR family transcriptional regulator, rspAB operon transcriptional repressor